MLVKMLGNPIGVFDDSGRARGSEEDMLIGLEAGETGRLGCAS